MKKFTLMMVAGLFALAGSVQAQELVPLTADDFEIANGETKDLAVKLNYELEAGADALCGANFSLYLPDGIILASFDDKAAQDAASAKALKKNVDVEGVTDGAWSADAADNGFVSVKQKTDGGLLFVLIDQDDKAPFAKTIGATLCNISVKAIADVKATAKIGVQGLTNVKDKSVGMVNGSSIFGDCVFGINMATGINDIQTADATAPAYNLQGIRVNSNAKGVIIRDGKKMVVK